MNPPELGIDPNAERFHTSLKAFLVNGVCQDHWVESIDPKDRMEWFLRLGGLIDFANISRTSLASLITHWGEEEWPG